MKLDLYPGLGLTLGDAASVAAVAERAGLDGLWALEAATEPFAPLALAASVTDRIDLRTGVAVAFARNPMMVAYQAYELARFSGGRFQLGLGTQVRAHIERRFGESWSHPAARMGEFVSALHAIWTAWDTGERLDFRGEFYRHTLMTPMFSPPPSDQAHPPVLLAGVGPLMVRTAAEVSDGLVLHPLMSRRLFDERIAPRLDPSTSTAAFELSCPVLVVTGADDKEMDTARAAVRKQLAFYASTPEYRTVLDLYGAGDRADRLRALAHEGRWDTMTTLIDDELLAEFSVEAPPEGLASALVERYGDVLGRVGLYAPYPVSDAVWAEVAAHKPVG